MMKCELAPNQAHCPEGDRERWALRVCVCVCSFLMPVALSEGIKHLIKCLRVHFVVYLRRGQRAHSHTRAEPPSELTGCRAEKETPCQCGFYAAATTLRQATHRKRHDIKPILGNLGSDWTIFGDDLDSVSTGAKPNFGENDCFLLQLHSGFYKSMSFVHAYASCQDCISQKHPAMQNNNIKISLIVFTRLAGDVICR